MKIKLLSSICVILSWYSLAQSELYVLMDIPPNNTGDDGAGDCDGRLGDYNYSYSINYSQGSYSISENNVVIKIDYQEGFNDDPGYGCSGYCGIYEEVCNGVEFERNFEHFDSYQIAYNGSNPIECGSDNCFPISYQAILLPKLNSPSDRICEKRPIFPTHSDGNNHSVNGLTWQYYSSSSRWEDIPVFKNRFPLNVSLLDIFGSNWRTRFNGNLQLRYRINASFSSSTIFSKNTYTIMLTECAPELVGEIETQNTKCNYTSDGKFTMTVDRDLVLGEKLIVSLYKLNQTSSSYVFLTQEPTDVLIDNSNQTYSYSWVGDIPSGNYKIKYQTLKGTGNAIPSNDMSWTTIGFSNEFIISNPSKLIFNVVKLNNESCFEKGDGKIKISVTNFESGRTFQYRLYKVSGSTVTIFKDWTNFSNDTLEIVGLDKSIYRIKVRDNKQCYER